MMNNNRVEVRGVGPTRVVRFAAPVEDIGMRMVTMTPERALELACWIVFAVDPEETRFDEIIRQIEEA